MICRPTPHILADSVISHPLVSGAAVVNLYNVQKPPGLRAILGLLRQTTQLRCTKITPQSYRNRHSEPPSFAMLNQTSADLRIPNESRLQRLGISWWPFLFFPLHFLKVFPLVVV